MNVQYAATRPHSPKAELAIPTIKWWALPRLLGDFAHFGDPMVDKLFEQHGDIFQIDVPFGFDILDGVRSVVLFRDPSMVKALFTAPADVIDSTKANHVLELLYGDRSLFLIDGPDHQRIRKLVLPRLRGNELQKWGEGLDRSMRRDVATWPTAGEVHVQDRMLDVTLESILQITLGITEAQMATWKPPMHAMLHTAMSNEYIVRYATRRIGGLKTWKKLRAEIAACEDLIYAEITRRRSAPEVEQPDLLDLMMRLGDPALTDRELRDQLFTILLAGHETTASTVTWAVDYLLHNPGPMGAAAAEARGDSDETPYLEAVLNETLRMHAPVPMVGRVTRTSYRLGDYTVAPDTLVAPFIHGIHRDATLYPDPNVFKPERFLDAKPGTFTLIPFGGGTHRCIGDRLALFQAKSMLRTILRGVDLTYLSNKKTTTNLLPTNNICITAREYGPRPRG
jgi:cytochrome P450 family 135